PAELLAERPGHGGAQGAGLAADGDAERGPGGPGGLAGPGLGVGAEQGAGQRQRHFTGGHDGSPRPGLRAAYAAGAEATSGELTFSPRGQTMGTAAQRRGGPTFPARAAML